MVNMNRLSTARRGQVISCLVDGLSIGSIVRVTGVAKNTITKLLLDLGEACSDYQDEVFRSLPLQRVRCDEVWCFAGAQEANVLEDRPDDYGDVWTWTAIDADSRLVPSWLVGQRTGQDCYFFLSDLRSRLSPGRVQLTTDGLGSFLRVVEPLFGTDREDFAQLVKMYESTQEEPRYSNAGCPGFDERTITDCSDLGHVSTGYVEHPNLTLRMGSGRFTRPTNAFSRKVENHAAAASLHFAWYNLGRTNETLSKRAGRPTTPAMAAAVETHPWSPLQIAQLLD